MTKIRSFLMTRPVVLVLMFALAFSGGVLFNTGILTSQATTAQTRITAAVGVNDNTIVVASATGFAAGRIVYIDREAMTIGSSYASGTSIPVQRGQQGTITTKHAANTPLYVGPPEYFPRTALYGSCASTDVVNIPRVNVVTGDIYDCREGKWIAVNLFGSDFLVPGESIDTNADYTVLLTDTWVNFTNFQAARVATLPSITGIRGKRIILTAGDDVTTATLTATAVVGQTFASGDTLSTSCTGRGCAIRLLSTGSGWVTW